MQIECKNQNKIGKMLKSIKINVLLLSGNEVMIRQVYVG